MRKIYGFMVGHRNGEYYLKMHGMDMDKGKPWSSTVYREQNFGKFTDKAWEQVLLRKMNQSNIVFITEYGSNDKVLAKKAYDKIIQNMNRNDEYNQLIFAAYEKATGGAF